MMGLIIHNNWLK